MPAIRGSAPSVSSSDRPQQDHCDLGENYGEPVTEYVKPRRTPETNKAPESRPARNAISDASEPTNP